MMKVAGQPAATSLATPALSELALFVQPSSAGPIVRYPSLTIRAWAWTGTTLLRPPTLPVCSGAGCRRHDGGREMICYKMLVV